MNFRGKISGDGAVLERVAFLGCYEPRHCGIATFTHDLCEAVGQVAPEVQCFAGAMNDRPEGYHYPPRVWFEIFEKNLDSYGRAADFLNFKNTEVLCVQQARALARPPATALLLLLIIDCLSCCTGPFLSTPSGTVGSGRPCRKLLVRLDAMATVLCPILQSAVRLLRLHA